MYSLAFIEKTQQAWQPYYKNEVTYQDGVEITQNITALFHLFSDWAIQIEAQEAAC